MTRPSCTAVVRPALAEDAEAVGQVIVAAGRAAWTAIFDTARMRVDADRWRREIFRRDGRFLVGEDPATGRVLGFSACGPADDPALPWCVGELRFLHVHPDAWGTGLAQLLHDAALDALRAAGFVEARLRTEERNHRALAFYARAGWRPDGDVLERDHEGSRLREPWLRRPLGAVAGLTLSGPGTGVHETLQVAAGATAPLEAAAHPRLVVPLAGEAIVTPLTTGPAVALVVGSAGYVPQDQPVQLASDAGAVLLLTKA